MRSWSAWLLYLRMPVFLYISTCTTFRMRSALSEAKSAELDATSSNLTLTRNIMSLSMNCKRIFIIQCKMHLTITYKERCNRYLHPESSHLALVFEGPVQSGLATRFQKTRTETISRLGPKPTRPDQDCSSNRTTVLVWS